MPALGRFSTALDAVQDWDGSGKVAIVTGGNSGIGVETVRALSHAGADVVLCSRSTAAGQKVADDITASLSGAQGKISVQQLDLADFKSIKACAGALAALPRIDILLLNAGVMYTPEGKTAQGFETQIGINHIGHAYLTQLLLLKLKAQPFPSRVVVVSSWGHTMGHIDLDDLNFERRKYSPYESYHQSKLANTLFARELNRRMKAEGAPVKAYSLHPGMISTNLARHHGFVDGLMGCLSKFAWVRHVAGVKTIPEGASTSIYAATSPELEANGGAYLDDCMLGKPSKLAQDDEMAGKLWTRTEELVAAGAAAAVAQ